MVGIRLTAMRRTAGLTQGQLAARIGSTQPSVARIEAGRVTPSLGTITRWVEATGIPFRIEPASPGSLMAKRELVRRALGPGAFDPYRRQPDAVERRELARAGWTPEYMERLRRGEADPELGQPR